MKKIGIILFLCIIVCNYIFAGPAYPGPYLIIQPNGDSIYVYLRGDEYGSFYTDLKGNVVDKNEEGYWVYVKMKRGKWFLTNQVVSKTSTPKKIDKKAVMDYIRVCREKCYQRRHRRLPEFSIKNERVKKWINTEINWDNIKCLQYKYRLSWLIDITNFGKYDYSCLILCENDSTKEPCFVHYYVDFSTRAVDTHEITSVVSVKGCSYSFKGHAILDSNFFEQINIPQNEQLRKQVNKLDKIFSRRYKRVNKLAELAQEKNKKYNYKEYPTCEVCEEFFKTHTLVDVIGYSYIKYPIGAGNKMK